MGKVGFFLQQSPVLQKHISTSNPAAPQELVPVLPPAAPCFGCVTLAKGQQHPGGCFPAGRGELIPCTVTAVSAETLCKRLPGGKTALPTHLTACSLARDCEDTSRQLNSHVLIAMKTW